MKSILVPTENIPAMTAVLQTALLLAQRCGSYIEGFALRPSIAEFVAVDPIGGTPLAAYQQEGQAEAAEARRAFESFMQGHNVARADGGGSAPSFGWREDAPEGEGFVGSYGRVFDVIVLGRRDAGTIGLHNRAIEAALFESGRPLLLAPPVAKAQIATNIMIHWNGSTEQSRTNAFAMPLLQKAERVTVLTVAGGQAVPGPSVEQVLAYLRRNGVTATPMSVAVENRNTGEAVLAAAKAQGCDLLIKGAFTQSRFRQMIFGGATSHILGAAELPVLMAH